MKKAFAPIGLIVLLIFGLSLNAFAATTVASNFNVSTPGALPSLAFTGTLQCMVQINAPTGNFQATPQFSTDNSTWVTATVVGGGTIGQPGVYIGTVPVGPGYAFFRVFFNRISVPISGQLVCGDSLPPSQGSGSGTVTSVAASAPLQSTGGAAPIISDLALYPNLVAPYGAVCDGSTDDKTIINSAAKPVGVPLGPGCFFSTDYTTLPDGLFNGPGNVLTHRIGQTWTRPQNMAVILTPPSYTDGNAGAPYSMFTGDTSHIVYQFQTYTGVNGIATPAPGQHLASHMTNGMLGSCENASGYQDPITQDRTGYHCMELFNQADATSNGDTATYRCQADGFQATSNQPWPGEPAILCFGGQLTAHHDNVYMEGGEIHLMDSGHDDSAIAYVMNEVRNNGTAGNQNSWEGYDLQSQGSAAVDCFFCGRGLARIGIDLTNQNKSAPVVGQIGVALPPDSYVYSNCANSGTFSRYTTCPDTGVAYVAADGLMELHTAGAKIMPQAFTGTCSLSTSQTCTATQAVVAGSICNSQFTSSPAVDSTHTLLIWTTISTTTLTTHVTVAQATNSTSVVTWNTLCH